MVLERGEIEGILTLQRAAGCLRPMSFHRYDYG